MSLTTNCLQRSMLSPLGRSLRPFLEAKRQSAVTKNLCQRRSFLRSAYFPSGALQPMPEGTSFAMGRVLCAVVPGLFIGAAISKSVANFLEENDLFVPDDDDDVDNDD